MAFEGRDEERGLLGGFLLADGGGQTNPIGLAYSGCGELEPGSSLLSRGANLERLAAVLLD